VACSQLVSAVISSLDSFPAQPCTCRRHNGAVSTSPLTFQPYWLLVVRSASISVLGSPPSVSPSPLTYPYLVIRIWPTKLRKVSAELPSLLEILRSAEAQYKAGQSDDQALTTARSDVKHCEEACKDLQSLLKSAYPKDDANKVVRLFKGAETVLSGKGKTAKQLLADMYGYLKLLMDRWIPTNATLLEEIKKTVDELFPKSGITQIKTQGSLGMENEDGKTVLHRAVESMSPSV
jgi:hypothetical protein